jgi:hypothetical protein
MLMTIGFFGAGTSSEKGDGGPRTLKTVNMASRVLDAVRERDEVGASELAAALDISKSTAYTHSGRPTRTAFSSSGGTSVMQGDRFQEEMPQRVIRSANVIEVNINMNTQPNQSV